MAEYGGFPNEVLKQIVQRVFINHVNDHPNDLAIFNLARTSKKFRDLSLEVMYPVASNVKVISLQPRRMMEYKQKLAPNIRFVEDPWHYAASYPKEPRPWCNQQWPLRIELDRTLYMHDLFYEVLYPRQGEFYMEYTSNVSAQAQAARMWVHQEFSMDVNVASFVQKVWIMRAREVKTFQMLKEGQQELEALEMERKEREARERTRKRLQMARERIDNWQADVGAQLKLNIIVDQKVTVQINKDEDLMKCDDFKHSEQSGDFDDYEDTEDGGCPLGEEQADDA